MQSEANEVLAELSGEPSTPPRQKKITPASPPGAPRRQPCPATWLNRPRADSLDLREYFLGLPIGEPPLPGPKLYTLSRHYEEKEREKRLRCRTKLEAPPEFFVSKPSTQRATITEHLKRLAEECNNDHGNMACNVSSPILHSCPLENHKRQKLKALMNLEVGLVSASFQDASNQSDTQPDFTEFFAHTPGKLSPPYIPAGYHFDDSSSSPSSSNHIRS